MPINIEETDLSKFILIGDRVLVEIRDEGIFD